MVMSVWLAMLFMHATCTFSSDSDPTVILSLAPPAHPNNDISNLLGSWEAHEEEVEEDGLAHLEDVYSTADRQTRAGIAKVISRLLPALATTQSSFLQKQHGERASLRVHVVGEEDAIKEDSVIPRINSLEQSLQGRERGMLKIAADELKELSVIIVEAFNDALSEHMKGLARGNAFLQRSRLPQAANVRVLPAPKEWPSMSMMAQHRLERRGISESLLREEILQLKLRLCSEANAYVKKALRPFTKRRQT